MQQDSVVSIFSRGLVRRRNCPSSTEDLHVGDDQSEEDKRKQEDLRERIQVDLIHQSFKLSHKRRKWTCHLDDQTLCLMVRCVVHKGGVTDYVLREDREGLDEEEDDDIWDGGDEGDSPDQCDQSVRSLHRAELRVMERPANSNVAFNRHAGQIQRTVPAWRQLEHTGLYLLMTSVILSFSLQSEYSSDCLKVHIDCPL